MTEQWRHIPGYEGIYMASNLGRIVALPKVINGHFYRIRIMHGTLCRGRLQVKLCKNGIKKRDYIHRLVLKAFFGDPPLGMECCHFDGNPLNNNVENLRWDTPKSNKDDCRRHGRIKKGESHPNAKLERRQVDDIISSKGSSERQIDIAYRYGISQQLVSAIRCGEVWK